MNIVLFKLKSAYKSKSASHNLVTPHLLIIAYSKNFILLNSLFIKLISILNKYFLTFKIYQLFTIILDLKLSSYKQVES